MKFFKTHLSSLAAVIAVLCLCALISNYLFQFALVQGNSMEPSYRSPQLVVLNKYNREYRTGQVVLFRCDGLKFDLLKRIAACGGDTVEIKNGFLYVNGKPSGDYENIEYAGIAAKKITVPENCFFVLGDNISVSRDSRYEDVGLIRNESIIGSVVGS